MGTPNRTNILLNVKSTLEGITVVNGYNTTVTKVEPFYRTRDDLGSGELPWLGYWIDVESYRHEAFGQVRVSAPLFVLGCIEDGTWATMSASMNLLIVGLQM